MERPMRAVNRNGGGHRVALVGCAAAVVLMAAACDGGGSPAAGPPAGVPSASAPATASAGSGGGTTGPSASATVTVTAAPGVPVCASSVLAAATVDSEGAAGTVYRTLTLTNTSSARCSLHGYPGVSFVDAGGNQLGAPADRTDAAGPAVVLEGGGKAQFQVLMVQPGLLPGCDTEASYTQAASLRIYPPDNTVALLVPAGKGRQACSSPSVHQLRVTAVSAAH